MIMTNIEVEIRERLVILRQELNDLDANIDDRLYSNTVTDLKLGYLLKRQHELKLIIEKLEDDLIPDMPA